MKTTYALDTNTVSYLLRKEGGVGANFQSNVIVAGNAYAIPFFVLYEVKRWLLDRPTKQVKIFAKDFEDLFCGARNLAEMPAAVWDKAAQIYIELKQLGKLIGDADILIAAYCLVNDYTLVTRNRNDFGRIEGLKCVNWYDE